MEKNYIFYENLIKGIDFEIDNYNFKSSHIYWDLIIVTSISENQKLCYEKQIQTKLNKNKLPKSTRFLVINDPNNCKIGSGGSTLNVVKIIFDKYNNELFNMKILLIHAGGYSQRMPSCSVLGKIFAPIPCKSDYVNDIFDLKLAIYTPFSINMKPGIFVTSSDDFETFIFEEQIQASNLFGLNDNEFILLAHKSSLEIAKDHGVYVLDEQSLSNKNDKNSFGFYECKTVYQKPSIENIISSKMCLNNNSIGNYAYTDSVFFFSHSITRDLLQFYDRYFQVIVDNQIEIDAYRDFLQPLGTNRQSLHDYISSLKIPNEKSIQLEVFSKMYDLFKDRGSKILAMNDSEFYHLGTVNEVMHYYLDQCSNVSSKFRNDLCFVRVKLKSNLEKKSTKFEGCLINSFVGAKSKINVNSILEFCYFDDEIELETGDSTLLSNCMFNIKDYVIDEKKINLKVSIPKDVCIHTVPVQEKNIKYVSIFFNRNDDLKKNYADLNSLIFLGKPFGEYFSKASAFNCENNIISIWSMKMFKAYDTMSQSFYNSCILINNFKDNNIEAIDKHFSNDESSKLYSLFDLLKCSDYDKMIQYRLENSLI